MLKYFTNKDIVDVQTCRGLIANAFLAEDYEAARHYNLKLSNLLSEDHEQSAAYEAMLNVLRLDLDPRTNVSTMDVIRDLAVFQEKTDLTGFYEKAGFILENEASIPELFEKYFRNVLEWNSRDCFFPRNPELRDANASRFYCHTSKCI